MGIQGLSRLLFLVILMVVTSAHNCFAYKKGERCGDNVKQVSNANGGEEIEFSDRPEQSTGRFVGMPNPDQPDTSIDYSGNDSGGSPDHEVPTEH